MFVNLKHRFDKSRTKIDGICIDNCCKWADKLNLFFPGVPVKLDLFHAVQRFVKTISKHNPFFREVSNDYGLVFRDNRDLGDKRTMDTPHCNVLLANLERFLLKWKNVKWKDTPVISPKGTQQLKNIKKHIKKGCLSRIQPKCSTSKNERIHREMKNILSRQRLSVAFAYARFSRMFFRVNNQKETNNKGIDVDDVTLKSGMTSQPDIDIRDL